MRRTALPFLAWLIVLLAACGAPAARLGPTRAGGATPPADTLAGAERARGDPNAPVTLVEYGDYQ
jgi:hypothetical protein